MNDGMQSIVQHRAQLQHRIDPQPDAIFSARLLQRQHDPLQHGRKQIHFVFEGQ